MRIYVDHTHVWRHVTGVERVTLKLFSKTALAPFDLVPIEARSFGGMVFNQQLGLPALLALSRASLLLCPGFPPAPLLQAFGARVIPYIHDVFLLSRRGDLNWRAKVYSAWPFALALRRLRRFLVNTHDTGNKLAAYCRADADVIIYRPPAENAFGLSADGRAARMKHPAALRLAAIGTVEPRKNLPAAAQILSALRQRGFADATLDIVGRRGWGEDWETLTVLPGVTLHGYQSETVVREILDAADALICTSHEEGLGLPLLEAQYAGLPVIAPDHAVFHEVLGASAIFIDQADAAAAAAAIECHLATDGWRAIAVERAAANLRRWNDAAASDRDRVVEMLGRLARDGDGVTRQFGVARKA